MRVALGVLVVALATACGGGTTDDEPMRERVVVFSFFEDTPGVQLACPGLWAADASGTIVAVAGPDTFYPRFSADGRLLAFATFGDPSRFIRVDLHVLDVATGDVRSVAEDVWPDYRWSPVDDEILARRFMPRPGRVVVVDAGGERTVAHTAAAAAEWAPDGKRIAYVDDAGVWIADTRGEARHRVADEAGAVAWSPDGTELAILAERRGLPFALDVVPATGGPPRRLATVSRERAFVAWSDEETILVLREPPTEEFFPGREYGVADLYRVDLATGDARRVYERILPVEIVGGRLLFARAHEVEGEWVFTVRTARLDGGDERVLAAIDEQDVNGGSVPSLQRAGHRVSPARGWFAPRAQEGCATAIASFRDRLARR